MNEPCEPYSLFKEWTNVNSPSAVKAVPEPELVVAILELVNNPSGLPTPVPLIKAVPSAFAN